MPLTLRPRPALHRQRRCHLPLRRLITVHAARGWARGMSADPATTSPYYVRHEMALIGVCH
jgi:hypothetical protein